MSAFIRAFDRFVIHTLKKIHMPLSRGALFIVFFWFGALKLFGLSPANGLVADLLAKTLPFWSPASFLIFLGLLEIFIGIAFLFPRLERAAIGLLIPHMFTTILPLFLLPHITWQGFLVPTMEGQYIIKNLVIIALAFSVAAHLHPLPHRWKLFKKISRILGR